jgi:hypothetical protein
MILGHSLVHYNTSDDLLKNNCRVFAQDFLEQVCPTAEIEDALNEIIGPMVK